MTTVHFVSVQRTSVDRDHVTLEKARTLPCRGDQDVTPPRPTDLQKDQHNSVRKENLSLEFLLDN